MMGVAGVSQRLAHFAPSISIALQELPRTAIPGDRSSFTARLYIFTIGQSLDATRRRAA
jgi:hypothetical protein